MVNLQNDLSVNISSIPVVVGELGRFYCERNSGGKEINLVLKHIAETHDNIKLVSSKGLIHKGDSVHFDAASQRELGRRYAEKVIELTKKLK
jgi:S-adenosylmethionine:tRNA-ribosyltransferase-isomerase (queuine synthetase)